LRADPVTVYPADERNRVLAFHRWVPGQGHDVVVVVSLAEWTFYDRTYALGFPRPGHWSERFNSDFFDHLPNPRVQGNPGGVEAGGPPLHGMPCSTGITIPANSVLVFAFDG
jgi:1,4-alpha-glucan branching enzyme